MLQPDLQYLIDVFVNVGTQDNNGGSSQSANAWVDPQFFLDPIVDPFDQLLLSPNANNDAPAGVAGVPEPSTWAMMPIGLAGLALAGYRERDLARSSHRQPSRTSSALCINCIGAANASLTVAVAVIGLAIAIYRSRGQTVP